MNKAILIHIKLITLLYGLVTQTHVYESQSAAGVFYPFDMPFCKNTSLSSNTDNIRGYVVNIYQYL